RFSKVRVSAEKGARTGFDLLSPLPTTPTGAVLIEDCQFDGPYQTFVNIQGTVRDFTFRRNRCWNATTAFLVSKPPPNVAPSLDVKVQWNNFHTVNQKTLNFEGLSAAENKIEVSQNYFGACKGLVSSPDGKPIPNAVFKFNVRDSTSTDGNLKIEMVNADYM